MTNQNNRMNPVIHFEMPAEDIKRMSDFYSKVFGWQTHQLGPEMNNYTTVATAESDPTTNLSKVVGSINGGFFPKSADNAHMTVVISVDDINQSMEMIKQAGGTIINGPHDIPGVGLYSAFTDTEGNRVAILQPKSN